MRKKKKDSERNLEDVITQENISIESNTYPQQNEHQHKKARTGTSSITEWLIRDSTVFKT